VNNLPHENISGTPEYLACKKSVSKTNNSSEAEKGQIQNSPPFDKTAWSMRVLEVFDENNSMAKAGKALLLSPSCFLSYYHFPPGYCLRNFY
jgi:hypothetical protein